MVFGGQRLRLRLLERPQHGGSVASGSGGERMQPGAVGGGDLAAHGARAREVKVDVG